MIAPGGFEDLCEPMGHVGDVLEKKHYTSIRTFASTDLEASKSNKPRALHFLGSRLSKAMVLHDRWVEIPIAPGRVFHEWPKARIVSALPSFEEADKRAERDWIGQVTVEPVGAHVSRRYVFHLRRGGSA